MYHGLRIVVLSHEDSFLNLCRGHVKAVRSKSPANSPLANHSADQICNAWQSFSCQLSQTPRELELH